MMPGGGYLPPVVIEITGNNTPFLRTLAATKAALLAFAKTGSDIKLGADSTQLMDKLASAKTELLAFAKEVHKARLGADAQPFWDDIAKLRTELASMSPLDIRVDANTSSVLSQISALRGTLALAGVGSLLGAVAGGGSSGGGGGGGLGGLSGFAGNNWFFKRLFGTDVEGQLMKSMGVPGAQGIAAFLPVELGLLSALFGGLVGAGTLGISSASAISEIMKGVSGVNSANTALGVALPGTTAWATATQGVGNAWAGIQGVFQAPVAAIEKFLSNTTPLGHEIDSWVSAMTTKLASALNGKQSIFAPLVEASQRGLDAVISMFTNAANSGKLTKWISTMSKMVGPAMVQLAQAAGYILQIVTGLAKAAGPGGQGMDLIVTLLKTIGWAVNSSIFQGFIRGIVNFDRVLLSVVTDVPKAIGALHNFVKGIPIIGPMLANLGSNVGGGLTSAITTALGVSAGAGILSKLLGSKALGALSGGLSGKLGASLGGIFDAIGGVRGAIGIGLLATGINGLVKAATGASPLQALGNWLGIAAGKAKQAADTTTQYKNALYGAIPQAKAMSAATQALIQSSQQVGSAISGAQTGFKAFTVATPESYAQMMANLENQNNTLASWAADAQKLLQEGFDPKGIADMAQTAPQQFAVLQAQYAKGGKGVVKSFNVAWQEQMILATMNGQKGVLGFTNTIKTDLVSQNPTIRAAATKLAQAMGIKVPPVPAAVLANVGTMAASMQTMAQNAPAVASGLGAIHKSAHGLGTVLSSAASSLFEVAAGIQAISGLGKIFGKGGASAGGAAAGAEGGAAAGGLGAFGTVGAIGLSVAAIYEAMNYGYHNNATVRSIMRTTAGLNSKHNALNRALFGGPGATNVGIGSSREIAAAKRIANFFDTTLPHAVTAGASAVSGFFTKTLPMYFNIGLAALESSGLTAFFLKTLPHVWTSVRNTATVDWNGILAFFRQLPSEFVSALSSLGARIDLVAVRAWTGFYNRTSSWVAKVVQFVKGLPGKIVAAFGKPLTLLHNVGQMIVQGLINGVKSMAKTLVSDFNRWVVDPLKKAPIIGGLFHSPSPYFIKVGRMMMAGLRLGTLAGIGGAVGATSAAVAAVRRAAMGSLGSLPASRVPSAGLYGSTSSSHHNVTLNSTLNVNVNGVAGASPPELVRAFNKALEQRDNMLIGRLRAGTL